MAHAAMNQCDVGYDGKQLQEKQTDCGNCRRCGTEVASFLLPTATLLSPPTGLGPLAKNTQRDADPIAFALRPPSTPYSRPGRRH